MLIFGKKTWDFFEKLAENGALFENWTQILIFGKGNKSMDEDTMMQQIRKVKVYGMRVLDLWK